MIDERSSSYIIRKTFPEPQTGIKPRTFLLSQKAQCLQRLIGHWKVASLIPIWGSKIVFLRIEHDEHSSVISKYLQTPIFLNYTSSMLLLTYCGCRLGRTYVELPAWLEGWRQEFPNAGSKVPDRGPKVQVQENVQSLERTSYNSTVGTK